MKLAIGLLAAALWMTGGTRAAAPSVIIISGAPLSSRVVLDDVSENMRLMAGTPRLVHMSHEALRTRPSMTVAMYWGQRYSKEQTAKLSDTVPGVRASFGAQAGRYYPPTAQQEALWFFASVPGAAESMRVLGPDALAILRRHGVPVDAEATRRR